MSHGRITPLNFGLEQNYPNPFNPTTNFGFRIADFARPNGEGGRGYVSLKLFDVLGREVAALVNEPKAAGRYEIEFDAPNLTGGVYFYRLTAGGFTSTK